MDNWTKGSLNYYTQSLRTQDTKYIDEDQRFQCPGRQRRNTAYSKMAKRITRRAKCQRTKTGQSGNYSRNENSKHQVQA